MMDSAEAVLVQDHEAILVRLFHCRVAEGRTAGMRVSKTASAGVPGDEKDAD